MLPTDEKISRRRRRRRRRRRLVVISANRRRRFLSPTLSPSLISASFLPPPPCPVFCDAHEAEKSKKGKNPKRD